MEVTITQSAGQYYINVMEAGHKIKSQQACDNREAALRIIAELLPKLPHEV